MQCIFHHHHHTSTLSQCCMSPFTSSSLASSITKDSRTAINSNYNTSSPYHCRHEALHRPLIPGHLRLFPQSTLHPLPSNSHPSTLHASCRSNSLRQNLVHPPSRRWRPLFPPLHWSSFSPWGYFSPSLWGVTIGISFRPPPGLHAGRPLWSAYHIFP